MTKPSRFAVGETVSYKEGLHRMECVVVEDLSDNAYESYRFRVTASADPNDIGQVFDFAEARGYTGLVASIRRL